MKRGEKNANINHYHINHLHNIGDYNIIRR